MPHTKYGTNKFVFSIKIVWLHFLWAFHNRPYNEMSSHNIENILNGWQKGRSQWPRGLRRGSTASCLLGLWIRIPPRTWMSVCVEYCALSGRGLCDGLITRPEKSYRLWCVVVWSRNLKNEELMARVGPQRHRKKKWVTERIIHENKLENLSLFLFFYLVTFYQIHLSYVV